MSSRAKSALVLFTCLCLLITCGAMAGYQDKELDNQKLKNRVEMLEKRIEQMERVVFSTAKLSVMQAERRLTEAEENLRNSKLLYAKGFANEFQLQRSQFDVEEAVQQLSLAKSENRQKEIASNLEFIQLERNLKDAQAQLNYKKSLYERGYSSQAEIDRLQRRVDEMERAVANAKMKLDAAKRLEALKGGDDQ